MAVARIPVENQQIDEVRQYSDSEIESPYEISQNQLNDARLYKNREEYIKTFKAGTTFMEIGVAWGYYSKLFCDTVKPLKTYLLDWFNQDLRCWSWRKFGECKCDGMKHELLYTPETHLQYISDLFADYSPVILKGHAQDTILSISDSIEYIYIDVTNDRNTTKDILWKAAKLTPIGGIIGLNDYLIYDGIIEDQPYGTYQTVNEFLHYNKNWVVDAIALHQLGFYDIYIRRVSNDS